MSVLANYSAGSAPTPTTSQSPEPHALADSSIPGTNLGAVLHALAGTVRRKGIVVVISDCFDDEDSILTGIGHLRFAGSEVILLHTMDAMELEFTFTRGVEFVGLENTGKLKTRPAEIRDSYLAEVESFRRRLREGCEKTGCHYYLVNTSKPVSENLTGYLAFRARAVGR